MACFLRSGDVQLLYRYSFYFFTYDICDPWGIVMDTLVFTAYPLNKLTIIDKIWHKCVLGYAVIGNNNILNYWLSLCSKCPAFALTYTRRRVRHKSQAVRTNTRMQVVDVFDPLLLLH